MDDVRTLDLVRNAGAFFISHPNLFGAQILYVSKNGIGQVKVASPGPNISRTYSFKTSGLLAYKIVFYEPASTKENIHVIYKV